jgi:hypothetical protein
VRPLLILILAEILLNIQYNLINSSNNDNILVAYTLTTKRQNQMYFLSLIGWLLILGGYYILVQKICFGLPDKTSKINVFLEKYDPVKLSFRKLIICMIGFILFFLAIFWLMLKISSGVKEFLTIYFSAVSIATGVVLFNYISKRFISG